MELTTKEIEQIIVQGSRRVQAAISAGGISEQERFNGRAVPEGYKLDYPTWYWIPSNLVLI